MCAWFGPPLPISLQLLPAITRNNCIVLAGELAVRDELRGLGGYIRGRLPDDGERESE